MKHEIKGQPSFCYIDIEMEPGDEIITESGAMASMSSKLNHAVETNGGIFQGLLRKFFGKESFFINVFSNYTQQAQTLTLTRGVPGDIKAVKLDGNKGFYTQPGAFIACTPGVNLHLKYAGIRSFIAREGLFRLYINGTGTVWFGSFGQLYTKEIDGEYLIDTSHVVAYSPGLNLDVQLSGGLISSYFSGEGFITRMSGKGKVYLQSRSLSGMAAYVNPKI